MAAFSLGPPLSANWSLRRTTAAPQRPEKHEEEVKFSLRIGGDRGSRRALTVFKVGQLDTVDVDFLDSGVGSDKGADFHRADVLALPSIGVSDS